MRCGYVPIRMSFTSITMYNCPQSEKSASKRGALFLTLKAGKTQVFGMNTAL